MTDPKSRGRVEVYYLQNIGSRETAGRFFHELSRSFPEFEIERVGQWEPLKQRFDPEIATKLWTTSSAHSKEITYCNLILEGDKPSPFHVFVDWFGKGSHRRFADSITIEIDEAKDGLRMVEMFRFLLRFDRPFYGRITTSAELETKNWQVRRLPDGKMIRESISLTPREGLVDLYWANFFGQPYIEAFAKPVEDLCASLPFEGLASGVAVYLAPPAGGSLRTDSRLYGLLRGRIGDQFFYNRESGTRPSEGPIFRDGPSRG